jgi:hypothetical protein
MPLKKLKLIAGVNKENTRYTNENGWYDSQWVRFRQGTPEKIGGWARISANTFLGLCRSLWNWITLGGLNLLGVGTNLKFYIEVGGAYKDITPTKPLVTLTNPFATTSGSPTVTVTDAAGGFINGDFVTFTGGTAVGGLTIAGEYQITKVSSTSYTITASSNAGSTATGGGTVYAVYQINVGPSYQTPLTGWGSGSWGSGTWGYSTPSTDSMRLWSQTNFGENLLFGPRGGPIYYWTATLGINSPTFTVTIASPGVVTTTVSLSNGDPVILQTTGALPTGLLVGTVYYVVNSTGTTFSLAATQGGTAINTSGTQSGTHTISNRGIDISYLGGDAQTPLMQNYIMVSDTLRFVFAFGTNDYGSTVQNPMLVRWSDKESLTVWDPDEVNQAGSSLLSHGSEIVTAIQTRQELVVFTDSSLYSMQYLGAEPWWGTQLLGDNISIISQNAVSLASGVVYWMGVDKFYRYDGRIQTQRCDLRQYIYGDINLGQSQQIFSGTNEGFNEVWWFYCSITGADGTGTPSNPNTVVDRYVVFNYVENNGEGVWYYGELGRTAWLDTGLRDYPIATTYSNNIVNHEFGTDDNTGEDPVAIYSLISSSEFDIDDGDKFGFVWRILPDITFRGSTAESPTGTLTLIPMQNSGSGYNNPTSQGGVDYASVTRTATVPIEQFTGQVYVRVRGRQMIMQFENEQIGSQWQLGSPRIDIKQDGRRGNT